MCLKSCCCCSLKTGTIIIASLGWIFTLIKIFGLVQYAIQKQKDGGGADGASLGLNIGYAVVSLLTCILLVVGVMKNNRYYLLPWLILECLECVVFSILTILFLVVVCSAIHSQGLGLLIFLLLLMVSISGLCWYFWAAVLSYYKQLGSGVGGKHTV